MQESAATLRRRAMPIGWLSAWLLAQMEVYGQRQGSSVRFCVAPLQCPWRRPLCGAHQGGP